MFYESYIQVSNLITVCLLAALAAVIIYRRLYRDLPWFTIYIGYLMLYTYILQRISVTGDYNAYLLGFWYGNAIVQVFAFMVIIEVFRNVVRGFDSIRKVGIIVLVIVAILTVSIAILLAPYGSELGNKYSIAIFVRVVQVLQRSIRVVQIGLLISLFGISSYFALSWRNHYFGVALGYGLYACVNLLSIAVTGFLMSRKAGKVAVNSIGLIDSLAFKLTLILWIIYLWRADCGKTNQLPPHESVADLEDWDNALKPMAKGDTP